MTEEKTYNAGDEAQVKKRGRKEKTEVLIEASDLKFVMSDPQGRRFIWRLLGDPTGKSGIYQQSFDLNPSAAAFNEGARSRGLKLLAEITDLYPDLYLLMQSEAMKPKENENDD